MFLIAGSVPKSLAKNTATALNVPLFYIKTSSFSSGEILLKELPEVKDQTLLLLHSTFPSPNQAWLFLFFLLKALKAKGARKIFLLLPYSSYCRQDSDPYTLPFLAQTLEQSGADEVFLLEPHSSVFKKAFSIPIHEISLNSLYKSEIEKFDLLNPLVISPDQGRGKSAVALAQSLKCEALIMKKRRLQKEVSFLCDQNIQNRSCLLIDDLIDSGETFSRAAYFLKEKGALSVHGFCAHGLFSKNAFQKVITSPLESLTLSETVSLQKVVLQHPKVRLLPLASLLERTLSPYLKAFT